MKIKPGGQRIVRVQGRDGRGPWRPGFSHRWVFDREDIETLPPWMEDFGGDVVGIAARQGPKFGAYFGCGCRTVEQLRRWFVLEEYETLKRFGYSAVEIIADRIIAENERQLVFQRKKPLAIEAVEFELYP